MTEGTSQVTIVYWRDIPAQVIAGKGRRGVKLPLPKRFEQAIDRVAMKIGAREADAYLAEWRRVPIGAVAGSDREAAEATLARLLSEHDTARLLALIDNDGRTP